MTLDFIVEYGSGEDEYVYKNIVTNISLWFLYPWYLQPNYESLVYKKSYFYCSYDFNIQRIYKKTNKI